MVKLLIGNKTRKDGYIVVNIDPKTNPDLVHDARELLRVYHPGTIDAIESYHFIEHLTEEEGRLFLEDCFTLLKPGGMLITEFPDLEKVAHGILGDHESVDWIRAVYGNNDRGPHMQHKFGYTLRTFLDLLLVVGFKTVETTGSRQGYRSGVCVHAAKPV